MPSLKIPSERLEESLELADPNGHVKVVSIGSGMVRLEGVRVTSTLVHASQAPVAEEVEVEEPLEVPALNFSKTQAAPKTEAAEEDVLAIPGCFA